MSLLPSLKDVVVNALNRSNSVTVVNPDDIQVIRVDDGGNFNTRDISVTIAGVSSRPNYGEYTCTVRRMHMSQFFQSSDYGLGQNVVVPQVTTIKDLLIAIGYPLGFEFPDGVINDGPVNWSNGEASVILTAAVGNPYFYGSVSLSLTQMTTVALSTIMTRNYVTPTGGPITEEDFYKLVEAGNRCALPRNIFNFGPPQTTAEAGVSLGAYNSVVRITPTVASGYSGTYDIFFNRSNLASLDGKKSFYPDEVIGVKTLAELLAIDPMGLGGISSDEFLPQEYDLTTTPVAVTLTAKTGSYNVFGNATVQAMHYNDDVHTVSLQYSGKPVYLNYTTMLAAIKSQAPSASRLLLNIEVAEDALVTTTVATNPPFEFKKMDGFGYVQVNLVNRGNIYGRGGAAGKAGGDAVRIATDFFGEINITNLGSIKGGGGGGANGNQNVGTTFTAYGGGGQPYGEGTGYTTSSSSPGGAASADIPGVGGSVSKYSYNGYAGSGGGAGEPGTMGYLTESGYNFGVRWQPYGDALPGAAGKAVSGNVGIINWVEEGVVKPSVSDRAKQWTNYLATLSDLKTYSGNNQFSASANTTGGLRIIRYAANTPRNYAYNQLFGSCYGGGFDGGCMYAGMLMHGFPNEKVAFAHLAFGGSVLVELDIVGTTLMKSDAITRNNITAAPTSWICAYVTRMVYYDPFEDKIMECNPKLKTVPVEWIPPS